MQIAPRQSTVGRLMIWVALLAVVLAAWLYSRANSDVEQAAISANIRATTWGNDSERRQAVYELGDVKTTNEG